MQQRYRYALDLQLFSGEKTEKATPRKRQDSRKKGQVAKSQELPGAFILFFSFLFFKMFGGFFQEHLTRIFTMCFQEYMLWDLTQENFKQIATKLLLECVIIILPIMLLVFVIAIAVSYAQIGFLLTGETLKMKFDKINPISGFKNIFSLRSLVEMVKTILKVTIVGLVVYMTLKSEQGKIVGLSDVPLADLVGYTAGITVSLGIKIGLLLVVLSLADYAYQRYEYEKSLRMSKQDIKDEYKKTEGDPLIKGKIRERQRRMALSRMMQEVPKADVVITNPTHFAIALKYDAGKMQAPTVIAKGMDYIALKIKQVAKDNDIIMMENRPLARALYEQTEIGDAIPAELFQAVAEVLAYVYRIKGKAKA